MSLNSTEKTPQMLPGGASVLSFGTIILENSYPEGNSSSHSQFTLFDGTR
jgi:hypothetical protein